uniref:Uncharacterized protein n=1 Tax=Gibberella zeae TaxID=5518 RepID=A0A4E9EL57_GIBZA
MSSTSHLPPTSLPPPPPPGAYSENSRHMNYNSAPSMPPTPGCYRAHSYPPPIPVPHQASNEQHGGYAYSSSVPAKKKKKRAFQVLSPLGSN